jgi:hypothetical protein
MTNVVRVEAQFPNLTTGSGIVGGIDRVLEQDLGKSSRGIRLAAL